MKIQTRPAVTTLVSTGVISAAMLAPGVATATPCAPRSRGVHLAQAPCGARQKANPCAARSPCAAKNPCAARNPCAAKSPCAAASVDPQRVTRPKGTKPYTGASVAVLAKEGEALWKDTKLSTNGMSCNTCHQGNNAFNASFAKPYPHYVAMADDQSRLKRVTAEQMVQFCMVVPMAAKPFAWDARELAALTAYTLQVQRTFKPNPCAAKNPCAARNPCAAKNPCAAARR